MKNPLVSVIIPCYNYEKYVAKAIESVIAQSYKNIELIVINDGSTDSSDEVIKNLQEKFRFKYHQQDNQGIIKTRNKGVELAKGQYLLQLDADDRLDKEFIHKTIYLAQKNNADIVYTQVHLFGRAEFVTEYPEYNIEYLKHDNFIHASSLVSKKVFKKRQYDPYLDDKGYEDWDLFLDACMDGAVAVLLNEPLLYYRKHSEEKSRSDIFGDTRKETLARHHILSKQNAKHPNKMWYFSSYIKLLETQVGKNEYTKELLDKVKELEIYKEKIENLKSKLPYRIYNKVRTALR